MTGRGLGFCAGNDHPGYMAGAPRGGGGFGRRGGWGRGGGGMGRGWGSGRGRGWAPAELPPAPDADAALRAEIADLRHQLQALAERLDRD